MKDRVEQKNLPDLPVLAIRHISSFLELNKDQVSYSLSSKSINISLQPNLSDMSELAIQHIGSFLEFNKDKASYSRSCKTANAFFQSDVDERFLKKLQEAVLNDSTLLMFNDKKTVKEILDDNPWLLLKKPRKSSSLDVLISFSQGTQSYNAEEETLTLALKLKRLEMVQLILPYFNKLDDGKAKALAQWKVIEMTDEKKQIYGELLQGLVNVIAKETFSGSGPFIESDTYKIIDGFIKQLTTNVNVSQNNYYDVEHLLVAGYKADCSALNQKQKALYSVTLGLIKNSLPQEVRLFLQKKKALLNGEEVFNNRHICDDFIHHVEQREMLIGKLKSKLLNDFLDDTFRDIDPRSNSQVAKF
jgi:hypothetical protein